VSRTADYYEFRVFIPRVIREVEDMQTWLVGLDSTTKKQSGRKASYGQIISTPFASLLLIDDEPHHLFSAPCI